MTLALSIIGSIAFAVAYGIINREPAAQRVRVPRAKVVRR